MRRCHVQQRRHLLRPRRLLPVQLPARLGRQRLQRGSDARRRRLPPVAVETCGVTPVSVLQPRTARVTRIPATTEGRAWAAARRSPVSARTGGRGQRALRVGGGEAAARQSPPPRSPCSSLLQMLTTATPTPGKSPTFTMTPLPLLTPPLEKRTYFLFPPVATMAACAWMA